MLYSKNRTSLPLETTSCSCNQDTKEQYWGQQFWQMERDISVRPIEMTGPFKVDHLHRWSRIFRSDQTEMVRSIWWTKRNFRILGWMDSAPRPQVFSGNGSIICNVAHFLRHRFKMAEFFQIFSTVAGYDELCVWFFSQSETEKYFEWMINIVTRTL